MPIEWKYDHQDYVNGGWDPIPPGAHRVRIENAEQCVSKSGRDMIKMELAVSGFQGKVFYYMVFLPEYKATTNKRLGDIYASFGIPQGDIEPLYWVGKVGAAQLSVEVYDGKERSKVDYFIHRDEQGSLPAWQEPGGAKGGAIVAEMMDLSGETDAPF